DSPSAGDSNSCGVGEADVRCSRAMTSMSMTTLPPIDASTASASVPFRCVAALLVEVSNSTRSSRPGGRRAGPPPAVAGGGSGEGLAFGEPTIGAVWLTPVLLASGSTARPVLLLAVIFASGATAGAACIGGVLGIFSLGPGYAEPRMPGTVS